MTKNFPTLSSVIEHYLERRRATAVLSSREAVNAFRALMPRTSLSDRELAELFVTAAVRHRRNVDFDLSDDPTRPVA